MVNFLVAAMCFAFAAIMIPSAIVTPDKEILLAITFCTTMGVFMVGIGDNNEK